MLSPRKSFRLAALVLTFAAFAGIAITAKAAPNSFAFVDQVSEMLGMTTAPTPSQHTLAPIGEIKNTADMFATAPKAMFSPAAAFVAGNLVVERIDGTNSNANPVLLVEYSTAGILAQTIALPNAAVRPAANPFNLMDSATGTSSGLMTRSTDGTKLVIPGYNGISTDTSVATSSGATISRTFGVVDPSGSVDTSRSFNILSGNNFRSLASTDGTVFWAGGQPGLLYVTSGGTSTTLTTSNTRYVNIFNNTLYYSLSSSTSGLSGVYQVGTVGTLPTTASPTVTQIISETGTSGSPYGFAINPAGTIAYVADDRAIASGGGILRYNFSAGAWTLAYTLSPATAAQTTGARGLVVDWTGTNPVIYATTADATLNRLIKITDAGAGSAASLLTAAGTNTIFRGIAFAPVSAADATLATDCFRSQASGSWSTPGTWQSSHDCSGSFASPITATSAPTSSATQITIRTGHNVSLTGANTASSLSLVGILSGAGTLAISGDFSNSNVNLASGAITFNGNNNTQTLTNPSFSGPVNIAHTGTGGVVTTGNPQIPALLDIQSGSLTVGGSGSYLGITIEAAGALISTTGSSISASGNWTNNGTFTAANNSTVTFDAADQSISGDNTFYNLTVDKSNTAIDATLRFQAGKTQTITNALVFQGDTSNGFRLKLRSLTDGTRWNLHAPASRTVNYVDVKDSDATGSASQINPTNSLDSGNNINWFTVLPTLNINDVSQNEGNAGSTNFHFTVSLTAPAPADVHFNLQAFGDTASEVDDFNASTGTGLIAQGQSSTGFDILVHGDTIPEPDETFHVNITGITGATPGDTTGVGTITNDDIAETTVVVAGNVLTVTDVNGGTTADDIRITRSGPNVRIVDPTNALQAGTGCVQVDLNTVDCTYAGLTSVQVSSMDGNDTLTVNLSGGNPIPAGGINFDGGPQTSTPGDKLAITGNSQGNVTYNYTNAHDGSVVMSNFGTVSYTGLEPITNNGTATNVIFNLPAGPTAATLADNGFADGLTRLSGATFETTDFLSPSSSVQINRGNAADTMAVQALPELSSGLFIGATGGEFATVNFNGTINLGPNNSLSAYATGPISLTTISSDLNTLGAGSIVMTTATNIVMTSASSMQTADGAIVLNANQQASPTAGSYHGIDVNNALIESTGIGVVTVNGRGGDGSGIGVDQGVFVHGGGIIRGGNAAGVTTIVNGKGGLGGNGSNHGVDVGTASSITSNGGGVQVTGNGGSGGGDNYGVIPVSGGTITSGLNGNVTVIGTGGSGGGPNFGVIPHTGGTITSGGNGTVTVTGTGGNGSLSDGINIFRNGLITSGGSGAVSVNGTAGAQGYGVYMDSVDNNSPGARINSGGGSITVTGICNPGSFAIVMGGGATNTIASTGNAPITLVGDAMALDGTGTNSVNSGTGTTTIRQFNNNRAINLGTSDDVPPGLDLSDGELDRVTAGTLNIGDAATTPNINVDGPISQTGKTTNLFTSGTTTVSTLGVLGITGTVHSYLDVIGTIAPGTSPGVINADGVTIYPAGTLNIELGGTTPGNTATNHDQVNSTSADFGFTVDGTLNVSFYNGFVPAPGDTFTIITSATTQSAAFTTVNWPAGYTGTVDYSDPTKIVLKNIGPPATTPTVTTDAPTNVVPNSATLNGTATPNGGTTTAFFRYYASDPGATCVDSGGTRVPDPSGGTNVPSGNGATAFNAIINGLTPATPYWYCAFATNSAGTGVGSPPRTFTTPAVDYTITTAGAIVVTDVTGHSDGLAMFEGPAGQLHFTAPGRFFSINGAAATTGNSGDVALSGAASITVNENIGDDTIVISGITSQLPSLTVNGGTGNDITQISSAITFVTGANLDLDMQNDDPTPGNDQAVFASGSLVTLQGSGAATIKVSQSVVFALNAGLSVVNGNMLIEANQQAVPTAIAFQGVVVDGGGLTTSGTGNIDIKGKGGSDAGTGGHSGISVVNSGVIRSTAVANGGTVTLNGKGGAGFDNNSGVEVFTNGFISSVTGDISVTGAGGAGTDVTNTGIHVATGGSIRSTGAAKVTLSGTGGTGTGRSTGVRIIGTGSLVTSSGGNVSITGVGNAAATQGANNGVTVTTGAVVSATGGTATVTINGTAGGGTDLNVGVALDGANTAVSSLAGDVTILSQGGTGTGVGQIGINISSGAKVTTTNAANISITGTGGSGSSDNYGVGMEGGTVNGTLVAANGTGNVSFTGTGGSAAGTDADGVRFEDSSGAPNPVGVTTASGSLTITGTAGNADATSSGIQVVDDTTMTLGGTSNTFIADSIAIGTSNTAINAGANAVTLRQKTNGIGIDIGGADSATALGLTDFELDVITAGTLNFGDANTGPITSTGLNRAATTNLVLTNGSTFAITLTSGQIASGNSGNVTFNPGSGGLKPTGSSFASEVYSGGGTTKVSPGRKLAIVVNGATVNAGYDQLGVAGFVDVTNAILEITGSYTPAAGDSFTIIANDGGDAVVGTFVGLAEGAVVNVNGTNKTLTYVGGDGNDVVLKPVVAAAPTVQFSQTTFTGNESMNGIATLTRTGDTSAASTVHVTTTPGTATAGSPCGTPATADYVTLSQDFTFAVNEMVKQVPVFLCSDTRHELAPETINLTVTAVSNAAIGTQATTVMAINDTASQFLNSDQTHPTHGPISFGSGSVGSPYPSSIAVTGGSNIGSMRVTIYDLSIDKPDDLDLLLVGPQGQKYALMTDVGGVITPIDPGNPVTITFSDYATDVLPDDGPLQTGQFLPTSCGGAVSNFPAGAPAGPYVEPGCDAPRAANETMAGTFAGSSNGTWSLYVRDDAGQLRPITAEGVSGGQIAAGWGLEFSSTTASDVSVSGRVTAADGRGITNATVSVTGGSLFTPLTAVTGRNGAYTIAGLRVGETYIVTVGTRRFTFQEPSRVVNLTDNAVGVDFTASP